MVITRKEYKYVAKSIVGTRRRMENRFENRKIEEGAENESK